MHIVPALHGGQISGLKPRAAAYIRRGPLFGADAGCLLTLPLSLRNSRHLSRMRLAIWIVGLTALATSLDSAYGGFYGRAIARMLTDMANGFGLG
jgi:hypothetical protein